MNKGFSRLACLICQRVPLSGPPSAAPTLGLSLRFAVVTKFRAALDLVAFISHANAAIVIAQIVHTALNVLIDDGARLQESFLDV